jgi:Kef-type K+ transport system membrane component KefB
MIAQAGQIGFLLLLFEVGLEIDLPAPRQLAKPAAYAAKWVLVQYPIIFGLAHFAGLTPLGSFVSAAALTACSVGMTYTAWRQYPGLEDGTRSFLLHVMVLLEVISIILLSVETTMLGAMPWWLVALNLVGIAVVVLLVSRIARPLGDLFQLILERAVHWRINLIILLVLLVCAVGNRLGLSAPKTAFFLGLFMSRVHHDGKTLETYLAPISHRFLIPVFFFSLGTQIPLGLLASRTALLAAVAAALLLLWREMLHRRWLRTGGDQRAYLLLCPNLSIAALAAAAMLQYGAPPERAGWVLLTGLFMSVAAILALPPPKPDGAPAHG